MCVRTGKGCCCTVLAPHLQLDIEAAGEERTCVIVQIKLWDTELFGFGLWSTGLSSWVSVHRL